MTSEIDVVLRLNEAGKTVSVRRRLDGWIMQKVFIPLDLPSPRADGFGRMLCSTEFQITEVMKSRRDIAKMLSEQLTEALLDAMGAEDTCMGYYKELEE